MARVCDFASSLGRPVYIGLKKMKGLAPHPGLFLLRPLVSHSNGCVCVRGGLASLPLPERLPAICSPSCRRHAGVVSAQNWLTGELCVAVSPISWQRNLKLYGSPRTSSPSRLPRVSGPVGARGVIFLINGTLSLPTMASASSKRPADAPPAISVRQTKGCHFTSSLPRTHAAVCPTSARTFVR